MPENFEGQESKLEKIEPVVEKATKNDCFGLVEVDRERRVQRFEEHGVPMGEFNEKERLKRWENMVDDASKIVLVSRVGYEVAGYVHFEKRLENAKETLQVATISFIRKYQGRGLSLPLLEHGIDEAKKVFKPRKIRANVILENTPAVKFWTNEKKAGFKKVEGPFPRKDENGEPILWDGKPSHFIIVEKDLEEDVQN